MVSMEIGMMQRDVPVPVHTASGMGDRGVVVDGPKVCCPF